MGPLTEHWLLYKLVVNSIFSKIEYEVIWPSSDALSALSNAFIMLYQV